MPLRIIIIGNKNVARRITHSLSGSGIDAVSGDESQKSLEILKTERFDLALVDAYMDNLESTCYRLTWLYHTPVALAINGTQDDWDLLHNLDAEGFIPEEAKNMDLEAHFNAIARRGKQKNNKIKVLIIEDDEHIREALRLSFKIYWPEAEVIFSANGESGVKSAKSEHFDTILLDLILPDISGYEVLSRIRSFSQTPIIIVTVTRSPEDVTRAISLGANDFVVKPFKQLELMSRIRQHVKLGAAVN